MVDENEIIEKRLVYLIVNPNVRGIVMSITDLGETKKYDIFVDDNFKIFYSGQIALYVEMTSYNWIDINTFRGYLTAYQIDNPSGDNLYSLNSALIDFVPYQSRPALKLIHADEPRILLLTALVLVKLSRLVLLSKSFRQEVNLKMVLLSVRNRLLLSENGAV